jgi:tetratricopeptide (TPR) repeat protein
VAAVPAPKPAFPAPPRPGVPLPRPAGTTEPQAALRAPIAAPKPASITGGLPAAKPAGITGGLPAAKPAGITGGQAAIPPRPLVSPPRPAGPPPPTEVFRDEPFQAVRAPIVPEPAPVARPARGSQPDLDAPINPQDFDSGPARPSQEPGRTSLPPGEVEEILDESEFFVAQGLFDEGLGVLRDALAAHPRNRLLLDRIGEVEEMAAKARAALAEASQPPPAVDNSFQLAEKLADELGPSDRSEGSDVLDVEEVFAQFKKGVEQQIGVEDTDTHFDLGIAYKEMGLLDDAIHEFELCIANQQRECMAHTMIGLCHLERNDIPAAVAAFKKGLYAERKTEREELGLYFELGRAYEAMRDAQEALYYYEKVKKRDATFLDVQERIDALTKPQRPKAAPAAATEDLDAAFDELMGKE